MRRVVITGLGMINSLGLDKDSSFKEIINGNSGIKNITLFDTSDFPIKIAGEISNFNPQDSMNPKDIKKTDRFIQLGIKTAQEAMKDANFKGDINLKRFGISSAAGIGGLSNIEKNSLICEKRGAKKISPFFIPSALINMLGGFISIEHGLKGPNLASATACAAGTHAIIEATKTIMLNGADRMLVVGAESTISPVGVGGFASMKALSLENNPNKASRPFDKHRDGFVMGEGSGSIVLEEYESAKKRNAKIYGEIVGFGESGDAHHITSPIIDGPLIAMQEAIRMSNNLNIDYINAHGTSTPANDKNESLAIKEIFRNLDKKIPPVSSIKGQIGHCLGAAGTIEAVVSLLSMQNNIIPPTINYETKDEDCTLDYVTEGARKMKVDVVMSNSFGFGGTNGVLIFKKI